MTTRSTKARYALIGAAALFAIAGSLYAAETNSALLDAVSTQGASWASSMTTTAANMTEVTIQFPIHTTSSNEKIMNYTVNYAKGKPILSAELTEIKEVSFEGDKVKVDGDTVSLKLEGLAGNSQYYYIVTPVNKEGNKLTASDEANFMTTATQISTTDFANNGNGTMLGAADTAQANFTYSINSGKVTLKWQAITGASKFQFSMKDASATTYASLGDELVSKESFSFVVSKKGLYTVKIVPVDAGGTAVGSEKVLSVKIDSVSTVTGKGTPATGPAMNLVLMSTFLLMLMYVVYRFRTTK